MTDVLRYDIRLQRWRSICKAQLGFTVTLQSHCVPGSPPVSQWLDHSRPVCQLVDICLLPPPSVVMAANPPSARPHHRHQTPLSSPRLNSPAGLLHPSLVFPPDTSCEPLMLILQSTSFSPVMSPVCTAPFLKWSMCLLSVLVC